MSLINTGSVAKSIWPGINQFYGMGYGEHEMQFGQIFDTESSDKTYEEDVSLSGFGMLAKKTEGANIPYDTMKQGFVTRYTHIVYALGFVVTREMMEDCQYDLAFKKAQALGFSLRQTQETVAANVLNRAFNNSYTGGDGLELCSAAHVNIAGGTYSNELATAADLSEAALEQAMIDISNFEDDRGLKIAVQGKKLIIPTALQFEASRILKSSLQNDTANNAINAMNGRLDIAVNNYLTDNDAWFIKTDCPDGMKHFNRRAPEFAKDNDFDSENMKCKGSFRASWGWSDPRGIFGSPGA